MEGSSSSPVFTLVSNLDAVRDKVWVAPDDKSPLELIVLEGAKITADPKQEHPGGYVESCGDVVEIIVEGDEDLEITIGGLPYTLPPGRWMIPKICLQFHDVRTKSPCKLQYFFLDKDERRVLCQKRWFQMLGGTIPVRYMFGMAGRIGKHQTKDEALEVIQRDNLIGDDFSYIKTMQGTGVYEIHVEGYVYDAIRELHAEIGDCPGVTECTEPSVFSWLVYGRPDPMFFTITCTGKESKDACMAWIREKHGEAGGVWSASCREQEEDVTTQEDIAAQRGQHLAKELVGLRKLVEVGLLEPFE